jgi:signal transduction histidine kinase
MTRRSGSAAATPWFEPALSPWAGAGGRLASALHVKAAIGAVVTTAALLAWVGLPSSYRSGPIENAYVLTSVAVMSVQAALIAGLLMHRARRRPSGAAAHDDQAALQASQQEIRTLARRLIVAQEDERARIGRDLHDDVCQKLALLNIDVTVLGQLVGPSGELARRIDDIAALTLTIVADVQNVSRQLHAGRLQLLGLIQTIRVLGRELEKQYAPLAIEVVHDNISRGLSEDVDLCVYRVVQEALQNVVKHSGARRALVQLSYADQAVTLNVTDSGCGFSGGTSVGLGLLSMRERVNALGGQFAIRSMPGGGTTVTAQVPVLQVPSDPSSSGESQRSARTASSVLQVRARSGLLS